MCNEAKVQRHAVWIPNNKSSGDSQQFPDTSFQPLWIVLHNVCPDITAEHAAHILTLKAGLCFESVVQIPRQ